MLSYDHRLMSNTDVLAQKNVKQVKLYERKLCEYLIELKKSPVGLGFTLGSVSNWEKGGTNVFVKKILDYSPAQIDGRLQIGDKIKRINGVDVTKYDQTDIVKILRSVGIGDVINITIERCLLNELGHSLPVSTNLTINQMQTADSPTIQSSQQQQLQQQLSPSLVTTASLTPATSFDESPSNPNPITSNRETSCPTNQLESALSTTLSNDNSQSIINESNPMILTNSSSSNEIEPITESINENSALVFSDLSISDSVKYVKHLYHFVISVSDQLYEKLSSTTISSGVLGISVECRTNENSTFNNAMPQYLRKSREFLVKSILESGTAYKDGRLKLDDEIVAVQGIDVNSGATFIIQDEQDRIGAYNDKLYDVILGDVYHYNLASVFLKNLSKLNRLKQMQSIFKSQNLNAQPLSGLKTLIKEAASLYSSISLLVVRRRRKLSRSSVSSQDTIQVSDIDSSNINNSSSITCPLTLANSSSLLHGLSYGQVLGCSDFYGGLERRDDLRKNCGKKSLNELCQIENIFELNPDYRYSYSSADSSSSYNRYKQEEIRELHGRSHHERFTNTRDTEHSITPQELNQGASGGIDEHVDPETSLYIDEYEYDRALLDSNAGTATEQLYNYFAKDDRETHSGLEAANEYNIGQSVLGRSDSSSGFHSDGNYNSNHNSGIMGSNPDSFMGYNHTVDDDSDDAA